MAKTVTAAFPFTFSKANRQHLFTHNKGSISDTDTDTDVDMDQGLQVMDDTGIVVFIMRCFLAA